MVFKVVVVGVDGAEGGERAATLAARLVEQGGKLVLVHVVPQPVVPADAIGYAEAEAALHRSRAETFLQNLVDRLARPGLNLETRIQEIGRAADVLNSTAEEVGAELVVLGKSHSGVLAHLFGVTTVDRLEHLSKVPMLVAP